MMIILFCLISLNFEFCKIVAEQKQATSENEPLEYAYATQLLRRFAKNAFAFF